MLKLNLMVICVTKDSELETFVTFLEHWNVTKQMLINKILIFKTFQIYLIPFLTRKIGLWKLRVKKVHCISVKLFNIGW